MTTGDQPFVHPSAFIDEPVSIGEGTRIWHFSHIMSGAVIGRSCNLGQNVFVASGARLGNNVKVQNNVSLYDGVTLEDNVFCGPSCVFTNVVNPRAEINRRSEYRETLVRRGATIGANATIVCGHTVGRYSLIGAGAVVRTDVPDYALMLGVPARQAGWVSRHGHRMAEIAPDVFQCPETDWRYRVHGNGLICLDWAEEEPLPEEEASK